MTIEKFMKNEIIKNEQWNENGLVITQIERK
jgi:hypothetical protein